MRKLFIAIAASLLVTVGTAVGGLRQAPAHTLAQVEIDQSHTEVEQHQVHFEESPEEDHHGEEHHQEEDDEEDEHQDDEEEGEEQESEENDEEDHPVQLSQTTKPATRCIAKNAQGKCTKMVILNAQTATATEAENQPASLEDAFKQFAKQLEAQNPSIFKNATLFTMNDFNRSMSSSFGTALPSNVQMTVTSGGKQTTTTVPTFSFGSSGASTPTFSSSSSGGFTFGPRSSSSGSSSLSGMSPQMQAFFNAPSPRASSSFSTFGNGNGFTSSSNSFGTGSSSFNQSPSTSSFSFGSLTPTVTSSQPPNFSSFNSFQVKPSGSSSRQVVTTSTPLRPTGTVLTTNIAPQQTTITTSRPLKPQATQTSTVKKMLAEIGTHRLE